MVAAQPISKLPGKQFQFSILHFSPPRRCYAWGLLPDREVPIWGNIDIYPYLRQKILLSPFKSLPSLQQLLDRFERSSTQEVVGPHPMAYTLNDTGFPQQAQMM